MADPVLNTNIEDALSQVIAPRVVRQVNRKQSLLTFLPKVVGAGKNCAWDAEVDGAAADHGPDGQVIGDATFAFGADDDIPATLPWGNYTAPFRIGHVAQAVARSSHSPEDLRNLFTQKMFGSVTKMGSELNKDLFTGTGALNSMIGIFSTAGPLDSTGTYASIDRSSVTLFQGNKLANGGTPRAVSQALMREALREIFIQSGENTDLIVVGPIVFDRIGTFLEQGKTPRYDVLTTGAGEIRLRGGFQALDFDGIPIIRDKDCPNESMGFLNTERLVVEFLPTFEGQENDEDTGLYMVHDDKGKENGLTARLHLLGKRGQRDEAFLEVHPQVKSNRPNAHAWVADIDPALAMVA